MPRLDNKFHHESWHWSVYQGYIRRITHSAKSLEISRDLTLYHVRHIFIWKTSSDILTLLAPVTTTWSSRRCRAISQTAWISAVPSMIGFRSVPKNSKKSQRIMKQYRIRYLFLFFWKTPCFYQQNSILNTNPERANPSERLKALETERLFEGCSMEFLELLLREAKRRHLAPGEAGFDSWCWVDDLEGGQEKTSTKISMVPMLKFEQTWQFRSFRVQCFEALRLSDCGSLFLIETGALRFEAARLCQTKRGINGRMTSLQCFSGGRWPVFSAGHRIHCEWCWLPTAPQWGEGGNLQCTGKEAFWSTIYIDLFQQNQFDFNKKQGAHIGQGCYTLPGSGLQAAESYGSPSAAKVLKLRALTALAWHSGIVWQKTHENLGNNWYPSQQSPSRWPAGICVVLYDPGLLAVRAMMFMARTLRSWKVSLELSSTTKSKINGSVMFCVLMSWVVVGSKIDEFQDFAIHNLEE